MPPTDHRALYLAETLIACRSVTPEDGGCQPLISARLAALGFASETLRSGGVTNLWAERRGSAPDGPTLVFAGHTDVVPTGPLEQWSSDPFVPTHRNGWLYGRGAADMKGSIAAMVVAVEDFCAAHPEPRGTLAFLLTSDEEGPATDGTVKIVERLRAQGRRLDHCIVGEPTAVDRLGDMIKNGRRGTLSGKLTVRGVQGHIAYPHLAKNPIHHAMPALAELSAVEWDRGNPYFPPTSWQMSNIHAGTGATNVIPGTLVVDFNFRFCTESTPDALKQRVHAVLERHGLDFEIAWTLGGSPFLTPVGTLSAAVIASIEEHCGIRPELSTTGGTSDGRFLATVCEQVIELGPVNSLIHKIDEGVPADSIDTLARVYRGILERLVA